MALAIAEKVVKVKADIVEVKADIVNKKTYIQTTKADNVKLKIERSNFLSKGDGEDAVLLKLKYITMYQI